MTTLQEFRCEVCGLVASNPIHWFVIRCGDSDLTVYRWSSENANAAEPGTTAVKPTPRYISVAGLTQCARRRSQILPSASPVSHRFATTELRGGSSSHLANASRNGFAFRSTAPFFGVSAQDLRYQDDNNQNVPGLDKVTLSPRL